MAEDHDVLVVTIAIDAWQLFHSELTPEEFIGQELQDLKEKLLEKFYERFPGQRPRGDSHAQG